MPLANLVSFQSLCDLETASQIDQFQTLIFHYIGENNLHIPDDSELVLDILPESGSWGYYFVDHKSRSLFWVHQHDITDEVSEVLGYPNLPLLRKSLSVKL